MLLHQVLLGYTDAQESFLQMPCLFPLSLSLCHRNEKFRRCLSTSSLPLPFLLKLTEISFASYTDLPTLRPLFRDVTYVANLALFSTALLAKSTASLKPPQICAADILPSRLIAFAISDFLFSICFRFTKPVSPPFCINSKNSLCVSLDVSRLPLL